MHIAKLWKIFQPYACDDLIRLGKDHDGGYLVNVNDVNKTRKLLSFGVGTDVSFEKDFVQINDCLVDAYDKIPSNHDFFLDDRYALYDRNIDQLALSDILVDDDTFVKCDIEGQEYRIFDMLISRSHLLSGLVIEVHSLNEFDNYNGLLNFISKIGLKLVHVHVNNYFYYKTDNGNIPDILELSFTSSTNVKYDTRLQLPNRLDMPNNPNDEDFRICF